jgi:hypothetical protein
LKGMRPRQRSGRWPATDVRVSVAQGPQCREARRESPFASNRCRAAVAPRAAPT